MPNLGFGEMLVIGIVALLFVGPEKLPELTRTMGQWYARIRREAQNFQRTMVLEADRLDEEERLKDLRRKRREAQEEKDRKLATEGDDGTRAQPERIDTAAPAADDAPAPGFTAEEWADVPEHVRAIVKRRMATPADDSGRPA